MRSLICIRGVLPFINYLGFMGLQPLQLACTGTIADEPLVLYEQRFYLTIFANVEELGQIAKSFNATVLSAKRRQRD